MTLHSFWLAAAARPDALALVEPDGTPHTAGALLAQCNRTVNGLRSLGLTAGDAVAVMLSNGAPLIELALACGQAGFYLTPINTHLTSHEVAFILADSGARAVICEPDTADACRAALSTTEIPEAARFIAAGTASGFRPLSDLTDHQPASLPENRSGGFVMTYTSGTTGRPRGVRRPTGNVPADHLAESFTGFLRLFGIGESGVHLVTSPLYHTAVINFCQYSLHFGHTVVLMEKFTADGFLERVSRYAVTTTHMVPAQFVRLLQADEARRRSFDTSSLTHVIHSAAPCPVDVKRQMLDWLGPVVWEYYAASEGGGTTATPQDWLKKPGTVGKPWPISEIRILDDAGDPLPPTEIGTVWIRMGEYKFEYHGDQEKTQKAWSQGFFTVGDAGYLDADGYLFLCDRKSDMIITGGVNVYPAEIESVFIGHPAVADVAVFGIPDEQWGERIKAVIEPAEGIVADDALVEQLLAFARERLAAFKCPRSIDFTDALPRDANGKLYKRRLRDPYWEGRTRQI